MESQPRNPEFRNNPENFHPCIQYTQIHVEYQHWFSEQQNTVPKSGS